jgi:ubiquinone/menaquinone biosynthesis C-methylase UbiE
MGLKILQKQPCLAKLLLPIWQWDAGQKFKRLDPFLKSTDHILELGSGLGTVTHYFQHQGRQITPVDIDDLSLFAHIKPIIYNGKNIPFDDKTFDVVLLLTVLHHTANLVSILTEARRVGQKIMIIEDIYDHRFQQYLTYGVDSLINFEFQGHPHNNQTDSQWQKIFKSLNLTLSYTYSYTFCSTYSYTFTYTCT